ncbi:ferredoxin [Candidatus Woesearchaeota archaeon]|nr:ferredoxin [Candidatus Woesearchaeota archaeon]
MKAKVLHFKKKCTGCSACFGQSPVFWKMDSDGEGFSSLIGAKEIGDHWELEVDTKEAIRANEEAAEICPVNIIHVKKYENK